MSERTLKLEQRRRALRSHCAAQRSHLAANVRHIESKLGGLDRGIDAVRRFAARPLLIAGGIALLTMIGPRRMVRWAGRGAMLFATSKRVLRLIR